AHGPGAAAEGAGDDHVIAGVVVQVGNEDVGQVRAERAPGAAVGAQVEERPHHAALAADEQHAVAGGGRAVDQLDGEEGAAEVTQVAQEPPPRGGGPGVRRAPDLPGRVEDVSDVPV